MSIGDKEKAILEILSQESGYLNSKDIAAKVGVSTRTIARYVKQINIESDVGPLIISEKGKGYTLNYDNYLKAGLGASKVSNYSPIERRNEILLRILFNSPKFTSTDSLFEPYFISETVSNMDLLSIKNKIGKYNLKLVRKNRQVKISGLESSIRQAIIETINKTNAINLKDLKGEFPDLSSYDMEFIIKQLQVIELNLNSTIPYPYNINIFSHIYILINRYRKGVIDSENETEELTDSEKKLISLNEKLYKIAETVINNLSLYLHRNIPDIEKYYVLQYLVSSRLFSEPDDHASYSKEVQSLTRNLIEEIGKEMNISISKGDIESELLGHIKPMLNRVSNHINIRNKLLQDIKIEYADTFEDVKTATNRIFEEQYGQKLSEDEIGFLTLYFAKYIEQHPRKINVLIMCASGIGTSELLKVKVKKYFPQLNIIDVVSLRQYENNQIEFNKVIDLIITTIGYKTKDGKKPVILVNAMFTPNDQARVEKILKELEKGEN